MFNIIKYNKILSQNIKKFSIVTVCKNSKELIEETILSVVNQTIFQKKLAMLCC
jgi:hypothetical protein